MKDALGHGSNAHTSGIEASVPGKEYELAKAKGRALAEENIRHSAVLGSFPRGPMGLTPDSVKASPEFMTAKANFNRSFAALRAHNGGFVKRFAKEIRAERANR